MSPEDITYQDAKRIKRGGHNPANEFLELSIFLKNEFNVKLINGDIYEYPEMSNPIRLRLILDNFNEIGNLPSFWENRNKTIGGKFLEILEENRNKKYSAYDLKNLSVDYFQFNELAFIEVIKNINLNLLVEEFGRENIWTINQFWKTLTVFYWKPDEIKRNKETGLNQKIIRRIQELGNEKDEFKCIPEEGIKVCFDSKDSFDKAGNWILYYR